MAIASKTSSKAPAVAAHDHKELQAEIAELRKDLAALVKKCAALEAQCAAGGGGAASDDLVTRHEWRAWQRKVAKVCGIRL